MGDCRFVALPSPFSYVLPLPPSFPRSHLYRSFHFKTQQAIEAVRFRRGHARQGVGEKDLVETRLWRGEAAQVRKREGRERGRVSGERDIITETLAETQRQKATNEQGKIRTHRHLCSHTSIQLLNHRHKENQSIHLLMRQGKTMKVRRPVSLPSSFRPTSQPFDSIINRTGVC